MTKDIQFSGEAKKALELISETDKNIFITGRAGTGKSTLLEHIIRTMGIDMVVLAPTGIAAINVKGETIHSFFRLKPGYELEEALHLAIGREKAERYKQLKTILIDEISMVRADLLDAIDVFLQKARKNFEPFGGVRMIFLGDLYQLPPVLTNDQKEQFFEEYTSPYFFSAKVFHQKDLFTPVFQLEKIELTKIYRQTDQRFINFLNKIRNKTITVEELGRLNKLVKPNFMAGGEKNWIYLVATNSQAKEINEHKLEEIKKPLLSFEASKSGDVSNLQPNDHEIIVKEGAQVMFLNNDMERRWVNGTLGTITSHYVETVEGVEREGLVVSLENGREVVVFPYTWELSKYEYKKGEFVREEIGTFTQMPLKLAWAITIHKSQGKTFNNVVIDLGRGSFAHGQSYVALSRCTSSEGLVLRTPIRPSDVIVDGVIQQFMK
ncbi:MAG: AAA family ATPase [Cytophagales bacterium]|nr:AAA family ATPase [Cytophagales bacterium]